MSKEETIYLDQQWQEIQPQRDVSASNFTAGSILFNFNVSGLNCVSMNDSYFIITSKLTKTDGTPLLMTDKITYAHNWCSALFSNVSVRVSGQEVSVCNQYNHIAHTIKLRQMIDENLLSSNFRDAMDYDIDFTRRLSKHCFRNGNVVPQREDSMVEYANDDADPIRMGDVNRQTIFQPLNLGVFDLKFGELCGDISIMLNPNPNYLTACVESAVFQNSARGGGREFKSNVDYKFTVEKIVFMACYAKATKPIDSVKTFEINEYAVQNKPHSEQLEFQVLPSTNQITTFIQDVSAGSSTIIPATFFKVRQFTDAEVNDWASTYGKQYTQDEQGAVQVTLGNQTKPPIMITPQVNMPGNHAQKLRWLMSHQYLDKHKTYFERYDDWCASPYFCFDFMRDSSDTSGFVTIRSNYITKPDGIGAGTLVKWAGNQTPLLFCVSRYTRQVQITYNSGYVTDIKIQNT